MSRQVHTEQHSSYWIRVDLPVQEMLTLTMRRGGSLHGDEGLAHGSES